jgi:hypothetical protein
MKWTITGPSGPSAIHLPSTFFSDLSNPEAQRAKEARPASRAAGASRRHGDERRSPRVAM